MYGIRRVAPSSLHVFESRYPFRAPILTFCIICNSFFARWDKECARIFRIIILKASAKFHTLSRNIPVNSLSSFLNLFLVCFSPINSIYEFHVTTLLDLLTNEIIFVICTLVFCRSHLSDALEIFPLHSHSFISVCDNSLVTLFYRIRLWTPIFKN